MTHRLTPQAENDLDEIAFRIATQSGRADRAEQFIARLAERFHVLAAFPQAGRARDDMGEGRRCFPVEEYLIIYRIDGGDVEIIRVADARRWLCYRILAQQCWRILAHPRPLNLGSPRLDWGTWRGLESQSGFVRAASSRA